MPSSRHDFRALTLMLVTIFARPPALPASHTAFLSSPVSILFRHEDSRLWALLRPRRPHSHVFVCFEFACPSRASLIPPAGPCALLPFRDSSAQCSSWAIARSR
ncbi:hypothetical protein BD309DRAFT_957411 [Dichomitus squalens]|uniref:Uncharacterized protein n=1 Tax=Dichomitus squalens TaxID=114155 RepID=A0A4Q9NXS3_9APHY|nr:hypothetical protein BD309DRAFT_957411 [Dichomitus squalens]TBU54769.1 hypothetical protein BD310DRAFT_727410 [Dichomitus squalens]